MILQAQWKCLSTKLERPVDTAPRMRTAFPLFRGSCFTSMVMKITVKGIVTSVPLDSRQTRIAIRQGDEEFRVLPKAAGIDLENEINVSVEAKGEVLKEEDVTYFTVRSYSVLEDDGWDDEQ